MKNNDDLFKITEILYNKNEIADFFDKEKIIKDAIKYIIKQKEEIKQLEEELIKTKSMLF